MCKAVSLLNPASLPRKYDSEKKIKTQDITINQNETVEWSITVTVDGISESNGMDCRRYITMKTKRSAVCVV